MPVLRVCARSPHAQTLAHRIAAGRTRHPHGTVCPPLGSGPCAHTPGSQHAPQGGAPRGRRHAPWSPLTLKARRRRTPASENHKVQSFEWSSCIHRQSRERRFQYPFRPEVVECRAIDSGSRFTEKLGCNALQSVQLPPDQLGLLDNDMPLIWSISLTRVVCCQR